MGTIVVAAVITLGLNFAGTGGYSQNQLGTLRNCKWSIGTNHGFTNVWVSYARWLATGQDGERGALAAIAIFLCVECLIFAGFSNRNASST